MGCLCLQLAADKVPALDGRPAGAPQEVLRQGQALRARVEEFYSLLRLGLSTRAAEYVAEDSRDNFLNQPKNPFTGFEVESVKLDPDGKTATVSVQMQVFTQFSPTPVSLPRTTSWTLVNGIWYLVVPPPQPNMLPFQPPEKKGASSPKPPPEELKFKGHGYGLGELKPGQVKVARFPFTNVTNHLVTISAVITGCGCLLVKTEKKEYKPGESGELVVEFDSTGYAQMYDQTIVVKTDPGGLTTHLRIQGYVVPKPFEAPKAEEESKPKPNV